MCRRCPGRIAAGLSAPFAGGEIGLDVLVGQTFEAHPRFNQPLAKSFRRRDQADAGIDAMIAAREQPQALRGFVEQFGLRQDAPSDRDHGVGGEDERAAQFLVGCTASAASALSCARRLAQVRGNSPSQRNFIDVRGQQHVRLDAGLIHQRQPPWRARSEDKLGRPIMSSSA